MNKQRFFVIRKDKSLIKSVKNMIFDLPCPINISFAWNFGSLLGITFGFQLVTGIFLSMFYVSDISRAFASVDLINREIKYG